MATLSVSIAIFQDDYFAPWLQFLYRVNTVSVEGVLFFSIEKQRGGICVAATSSLPLQ